MQLHEGNFEIMACYTGCISTSTYNLDTFEVVCRSATDVRELGAAETGANGERYYI